MRLTDLEPEFVRYGTRHQEVDVIVGDHDTWRERGCPSQKVMRDVEWPIPVGTLAEAQGIMFLCPLCFAKNNGNVGTHLCQVSFADRGVLESQGSHDSQGKPVRWTVSGDNFENLSTSPSILLIGGCGWHGYITTGEVT